MTRKDPISTVSKCHEESSCGELVSTFSALRDGKQDAGDKGLAVMRLLKDSHLLTKTRTVCNYEQCPGSCTLEYTGNLRARLLVLERLKLDSLDVHCGGKNRRGEEKR